MCKCENAKTDYCERDVMNAALLGLKKAENAYDEMQMSWTETYLSCLYIPPRESDPDVVRRRAPTRVGA